MVFKVASEKGVALACLVYTYVLAVRTKVGKWVKFEGSFFYRTDRDLPFVTRYSFLAYITHRVFAPAMTVYHCSEKKLRLIRCFQLVNKTRQIVR